mmetsp:Transcript_19727/g.55070  ORF Transcript_19727/g.55070 Transcript_19727/m.55070 type:complete len:424 (+) Transcript_19727:2188-3459(+)
MATPDNLVVAKGHGMRVKIGRPGHGPHVGGSLAGGSRACRGISVGVSGLMGGTNGACSDIQSNPKYHPCPLPTCQEPMVQDCRCQTNGKDKIRNRIHGMSTQGFLMQLHRNQPSRQRVVTNSPHQANARTHNSYARTRSEQTLSVSGHRDGLPEIGEVESAASHHSSASRTHVSFGAGVRGLKRPANKGLTGHLVPGAVGRPREHHRGGLDRRRVGQRDGCLLEAPPGQVLGPGAPVLGIGERAVLFHTAAFIHEGFVPSGAPEFHAGGTGPSVIVVTASHRGSLQAAAVLAAPRGLAFLLRSLRNLFGSGQSHVNGGLVGSLGEPFLCVWTAELRSELGEGGMQQRLLLDRGMMGREPIVPRGFRRDDSEGADARNGQGDGECGSGNLHGNTVNGWIVQWIDQFVMDGVCSFVKIQRHDCEV